ncbi:heavy metal sensor histidine kinase [Marinobacterium sediminicola]|uniref:Sensor protein n=1 Tax=Marinobacterium sediminicola TaxID=518898 RepID=A0ABY1S286_9GAMM|nr:heavy metal sensor histidine kinase [Marinobacterium sediminicola]ULG68479.1 heavy metal sensor histidine kinase [Marinobacterium sediminicola]SMR76746.1 two-component system, OmpR family, heavy metal sensor histidine kinase CusS [Marinobacterium sediminicola]
MMSLTLRLTLLFSLVSVCILAGLGFLIQRSVEQHFAAEDFAEIDDKLDQVISMLEQTPDPINSGDLALMLSEIVLSHSYLVMNIESSTGKMLFESAPLSLPPAHEQQLQPGKRHRSEWSQEGTGYRGITLLHQLNHDTESAVVIRGGIETTRHTLFMQTFVAQLMTFMLLATLLSTLFGWLAVRKGLAPLRVIKARAQSVTAKRLDQRLPIESVPAEIAELGGELNLMLDRLEESFSRLIHFSSDIAHELRTPLSNLMTQTQVSLSQARSCEEYSDILASNLEEFERLSRMISDMLFLAKADNGLQLPSTDKVDMAQEVNKLCDFYEALAEDRQVKLKRQGLGWVHGDRLMIERALGNLISNAVRHTPPGGAIRIEIETHPPYCKVMVCNPGSPISDQDMRYIFDRFYRCDPSRLHGSNEGTGLGLPITRAIARAHGGDVSVTSTIKETCFMLLLPLEYETGSIQKATAHS